MTTTDKANDIIDYNIFNKKELSEELGISRPTLDSRLNMVSDWKKLEIKCINRIHLEKVPY